MIKAFTKSDQFIFDTSTLSTNNGMISHDDKSFQAALTTYLKKIESEAKAAYRVHAINVNRLRRFQPVVDLMQDQLQYRLTYSAQERINSCRPVPLPRILFSKNKNAVYFYNEAGALISGWVSGAAGFSQMFEALVEPGDIEETGKFIANPYSGEFKLKD